MHELCDGDTYLSAVLNTNTHTNKFSPFPFAFGYQQPWQGPYPGTWEGMRVDLTYEFPIMIFSWILIIFMKCPRLKSFVISNWGIWKCVAVFWNLLMIWKYCWHLETRDIKHTAKAWDDPTQQTVVLSNLPKTPHWEAPGDVSRKRCYINPYGLDACVGCFPVFKAEISQFWREEGGSEGDNCFLRVGERFM